jgi:hypothetical protein
MAPTRARESALIGKRLLSVSLVFFDLVGTPLQPG